MRTFLADTRGDADAGVLVVLSVLVVGVLFAGFFVLRVIAWVLEQTGGPRAC